MGGGENLSMIQSLDEGNKAILTKSSVITKLRNSFHERSDDFRYGMALIYSLSTKYWPNEMAKQLRLMFSITEDLSNEEVIQMKSPEKFYKGEDSDWDGLGKIVEAIENVRDKVLQKDKLQ